MVAGILKGDVSKPGHSTTHTKGIMCTPHLMYTTSAPSFEIPVCPSCLHSYPLFPLLFLCPSSHPPFLQFIFQFAPRSSQVCARRKFAEAAGAPLEATWRRDRRGTIRPSPPSLSLPHVFSFYPPPMPLFFSFSLTFISTLSLSLSCLFLSPLYPACQATQVLRVTCIWRGTSAQNPLLTSFIQHSPSTASPPSWLQLSSFPSTLLLPSPDLSPGGRR